MRIGTNRVGDNKYNSPKRLEEIMTSKANRARRKREKFLKKVLDPLSMRKKVAALRMNQLLEVKVLSEKQHKCIALLADFMNCWSPEYIIGQCEITLKTLYAWRNDPFFLKELDKEITRRKTVMRLEAHRLLFRLLKRGKPRILLAYLKMTGDFKEQVEVTEKTSDDMNELELDKKIQELQDELGVSARNGSGSEG